MPVNEINSFFSKEPVKSSDLIDLRSYRNDKCFYICLHDKPVVVGKIDYRSQHCSTCIGDISYVIYPEYRCNGYAYEALCLLGEKLYEDGIEDFWISANTDNKPSLKIIEKYGGQLIKGNNWSLLYVCETKKREKLDKQYIKK